MTALAMILGMLPMALALGRGLRAKRAAWPRRDRWSVWSATLMTLFVVPAVYSIFGRTLITKQQRDARIEAITMPGA